MKRTNDDNFDERGLLKDGTHMLAMDAMPHYAMRITDGYGVKRRLGHNLSTEAAQAAISVELALNRLPAFLCSK
jgi:hypothetical protein